MRRRSQTDRLLSLIISMVREGAGRDEIMDRVQAVSVTAALMLENGNKTRAAKRLKISKDTLDRILQCRLVTTANLPH